MNTVSVKRNDNIDALKTICAFLVVCIHITCEFDDSYKYILFSG